MLAARMYRMSDSRRRLFFSMRKARGLQCNNHVVVDDGYLPMFRNLTVSQSGTRGKRAVRGGFHPRFFGRGCMYVQYCVYPAICAYGTYST